MKATGAVILAAGGSTRLGRPKQLLEYQGETLVRRAARIADEAGCAPVVIVAGDQFHDIENSAKTAKAAVLHHRRWSLGIGSSIRAGVESALTLNPSLDGLILMVCDQPHVTSATLRSLIDRGGSVRHLAVASAYSETFGVPALFKKALFPRLISLPDDQGAKSILNSIPEQIGFISFAQGSVDIDTPDDWRRHQTLAANRGSE